MNRNQTETRTRLTRITLALVGIAATFVIGCGGGQSEAQTGPMPADPMPAATTPPVPAPESSATDSTTAGALPPSPTAGATKEPMKPMEPAAAPLTDEQIAAITDAANTGEIDTSKVAQTKAKDARVKKFAAMMIEHHGDAKKKQAALQTKAKITPAENEITTKMKGEVEAGMSTLKTATGADFDRQYIDLQVKLHQDALDTIDKKLMPNVKNADLKAYVTELRPKVESHLTQAKELQTSMGSATNTPATPAAPAPKK